MEKFDLVTEWWFFPQLPSPDPQSRLGRIQPCVAQNATEIHQHDELGQFYDLVANVVAPPDPNNILHQHVQLEDDYHGSTLPPRELSRHNASK